jgi:hypothetical protein
MNVSDKEFNAQVQNFAAKRAERLSLPAHRNNVAGVNS